MTMTKTNWKPVGVGVTVIVINFVFQGFAGSGIEIPQGIAQGLVNIIELFTEFPQYRND